MQLPHLILKAYRYIRRTVSDIVMGQGEALQSEIGEMDHPNLGIRRGHGMTMVSEEYVAVHMGHVDIGPQEMSHTMTNNETNTNKNEEQKQIQKLIHQQEQLAKFNSKILKYNSQILERIEEMDNKLKNHKL